MKNKHNEAFENISDTALTKESHAPRAGLSPDEYERIKRLLGRSPNKVELGIIGALWSEHCSYKSSRAHLSKLPSKGPRVLVGPGENAGVIDIGDDIAVVFKIESHNHPSFVEPFQGAATGVGGILRDIFTMGARPFACANFLRFGHPKHKLVPHLVEGVVSGIASYGNCFGVPTVKTNIDFHESYNGNNLVNAFAIGAVKKDEIFLGAASGVKNRVLYVGAKTGRDGIMGAVMASDVFDDNTQAKRPTVQVGDPFTEKLLLEACFQAFQKKLVVGIQDMGAAGLSCASFEMANRASTGLVINLDHVPLRDATMSAYDIMLSESQERMLIVATPNDVPKVKEIFDKYQLACADIGAVTGDGIVRIHHRGKEVVHLTATLVIENAPRYRRDYLSKIPEAPAEDQSPQISLSEAIANFKSDMGQKDTSYVTDQFDHDIGLNTLTAPEDADAILMKIPDTNKAVALAMCGNGRWLKVNPYEGARRIVFEAALMVSAQGAVPIGITNCLNFGSPERVAVMTDFTHTVDGMAAASSELSIPIVSGNVSLYNETDEKPILPTLALCMVGISEQPDRIMKFSSAADGDVIMLLGDVPTSLSGAEPFCCDLAPVSQRPFDANLVNALSNIVRDGVREGLLTCAAVIGRGGLLHALAKVINRCGHGIHLDFGSEWLAHEIAIGLVSEDSPMIAICIKENQLSLLAERCAEKICLTRLGKITGSDVVISHENEIFFSEHRDDFLASFRHGLEDLVANARGCG